MGVVINRARNTGCLDRARRLFEGTPVRVLGVLPEDEELAARDADGEPIFTLPAENPVFAAAAGILTQMRQCVSA